ncbi:MAG: hypothetical protein HOU81_05290 [Hamadaea sp.]|uniref:hypothetical protein n=1 Tax=Hamadaea sp. TaxID=2024425 RepID=UPI00180ED960|nr:hypothetical protein [Hamadaea sp.]NUR70212.1 hypothetical protein [Hamadaea sp.]NUT21865.1 hypothetical protein [Hamadaea sp.]
MTSQRRLRRIRVWIFLFLIGLVLSGLTAFPLVTEVKMLHGLADGLPLPGGVADWIDRIHTGIVETDARYPFIAYGTDWLAFAHLVIALAFVGPIRDPVRNIWVVEWAMLACVAVVPLALIAGPVRGIPLWWTAIDISFGVFGILPLLVVRRQIQALARAGDSDVGREVVHGVA